MSAALEVAEHHAVYIIALKMEATDRHVLVDELVYTDFEEAIQAAAESQQDGWCATVVEVHLDPDNIRQIPFGMCDGELVDGSDKADEGKNG